MRATFPWTLALLLAGCGSTAVDQPGAGGQCVTATSTGSGTGAGGAAPAPAGAVCDELLTNGLSCPSSSYASPLVGWVKSSGLVFRGTVTALHATTAGIDNLDTSRTVVAHIDKVISTGDALETEGQDVTVLLPAAPTMATGYVGYFFTYGLVYGQTLGLAEVAHADPGVYPTIDADVPGIQARLVEEQLYQRTMASGSVVVGTVTAIETLPLHGGMSEHDPVWAIATIAVDCTLRGAPVSSTRMVFPTSTDLSWAQRPKVSVGQQGVFLLQLAPLPPGSAGIPAGVPYFVTNQRDVQGIDQRGHVATLVRCPWDG